MRVLVTGGCGFIGSHQVAHLLETGHDVYVVDNLSNSSVEVLDRIERIAGRRPNFYQLNVLDTAQLSTVIADVAPEATIHLAGFKHVSESTERVVDYYENNIGGLLSLLRACESTPMRRLVFSSSGSVYGETDRLPIAEDHPHNPTNPYSSSKSMCERILRDLCTGDPSWSAIALRYFNPAGAHPTGLLGDDPVGPPENLVPALTRAAATPAPIAKVYGDDYNTEDGSGVRDYVHVLDVVETHSRALDEMKSRTGFRALNVGRGLGSSVFDVIAAVERAAQTSLTVSVEPRRPGDVSALYGDNRASHQFFGCIEYRSLDRICRDAWRWQQAVGEGSDEGVNGVSPAPSAGDTPVLYPAADSGRPTVAIAHEWVEARSGSELLFEQLAGEFSEADLFALSSTCDHVLDLGERELQTTLLGRVPTGPKMRAAQLPLMPLAWRRLERNSYDLVITSTHAFGREFALPSDGVHCNYVHAPMRYVWTPELDGRASVSGAGARALRWAFRRWDTASIDGVTSFAVNSRAVADRVARFYERESTVIHPPVEVEYFEQVPSTDNGYLLAASRWVPYKRLDLAIDVAARLDLPLVVAGWGPLEHELRQHADLVHPGGVEVRLRPTRREMRQLMAGASAFVFPANEDFGIIAVEAQAAGTPVVALAAGGSLDTVSDGFSGSLAEEQTIESFTEATERCLLKQLSFEDCRSNARNFSASRFRREVRQWTSQALSQ